MAAPFCGLIHPNSRRPHPELGPLHWGREVFLDTDSAPILLSPKPGVQFPTQGSEIPQAPASRQQRPFGKEVGGTPERRRPLVARPCWSEMACQPAGGPEWGQIQLQTIVPSQGPWGPVHSRVEAFGGSWTLAGPSAGPRGVHERAGRAPGVQPPGPRRPPAGVRRKTQAAELRASTQYPGPGTTPGGLRVAPPQRDPPKSIPSPSSAASGFPICRALAGQRGRGRAQPRRPAPLLTKAAARSARPKRGEVVWGRGSPSGHSPPPPVAGPTPPRTPRRDQKPRQTSISPGKAGRAGVTVPWPSSQRPEEQEEGCRRKWTRVNPSFQDLGQPILEDQPANGDNQIGKREQR